MRRSWPLIAVVTAALLVVCIHVVVDRLTREPPNYNQIEDGLWLGGYVAEPPPDTRAVLNLCETEDTHKVESHVWEPIRDAEPPPSLGWLRRQAEFIASERGAGRLVFVHCRNGVSRSAMVMAAYLMQRDGWSRDQAMEFLRSRRPCVRPNPAFLQLLLEWERSLQQ